MTYRIKQGWPSNELFLKRHKKAIGIKISVGGKNFNSISEACRLKGFSLSKINSRLRYGWSLEEALEFVPRKELPTRLYKVKNSGGGIDETNNLSEYARNHKLRNVSNLWQTYHSDKHHSYKGFRLINVINLKRSRN